MKAIFFRVALAVTFSVALINTYAQKKYNEGTISYTTNMGGQDLDVKVYFTADSSSATFSTGAANIKNLWDVNHTSFALLLDVPSASIKKAAISTPDEITKMLASMPSFTYTPTSETKQISGFSCKKIQAKDSKSGTVYDVWVTNDITVPPTAIPIYYRAIGGFTVQYTAFQQAQTASVTVSAVTGDKVPAGTFSIPSDYEKITMDDLKAMQGGGK